MYQEITEWEERNGVASKAVLQAMQGVGEMLKEAVLRVDPDARIETYSR